MEIAWKDTLITVAPFVILLVLWFVFYIGFRRLKASLKKNLVDALQESAQTAVLPEIRALRESVDALRAEIKARDENS
jgi:cell division protein FtsB